MTFKPDPVSLLWERGAAALLARALDARGEWVMTRIADPTPAQVARFAAIGIDVHGRDNAATLSGTRQNMRSRWCRGFARAFFRQRGRRPVELVIGARKPAVGRVPAGRAVKARVRRGGSVAARAVQRKPDSARIYDDDGRAAGRWG